MMRISTDAVNLDVVRNTIAERHPELAFGAKITRRDRSGATLEIDIRETAIVDSILKIIDEIRKKRSAQVDVTISDSGQGSAISREFMGGYFRRR